MYQQINMILCRLFVAAVLSSSVVAYLPTDPPQHSSLCSNTTLSCSEATPDSCPPGLFCKQGECECGVYPYEIVKCNGTRAFVALYDCPSFDPDKNVTVVGSCHKIANFTEFGGPFVSYAVLPAGVYELDKVCHLLNRTGVLCGECLPDHYSLAYSYSLSCVPCPHVCWNWFRYIMAAYVPLTVFYFVILFFQLNVTSSHLLSIVFYCQTLSTPLIARNLYIELLNDQANNDHIEKAYKAFFFFLGIWNLDFFRSFYDDLCLGIDVLPTLALDYVIAVYPLFLIVLTYFFIKLHDQHYRVIVALSKPFKCLLSTFRRNWNVRTSVIDVFATFFLLSNVKLYSVSFDFLIPTRVYQLYPDHYNYTQALYVAGNMQYFGREHLPYAILAIFVLFAFILIPVVILLLYPFSFFQRFISLFPVRWHVLHTFMDTFHSCYKDGTQLGTRDYRWCAALMFVFRLFQFTLYFLANKEVYVLLLTVVLILYALLVTGLQPYKTSCLNALHIICLLNLLTFAIAVTGLYVTNMIDRQQYSIYFFILFGLGLAFAPLYFLVGAVQWVYLHKRFGTDIVNRILALRHGRSYPSLLETLPEETEDEIRRGR